MANFQVAIDGPAGSGKSSISSIVAEKLGFTHIDTGAMYRAVTLEALNLKINLDDEAAYEFVKSISVIYTNGHTYLNNVDVSDSIRTNLVTLNVSTVSKYKIVRDQMVYFMRNSAKEGKILMDGRDIGTVVLPSANLKIFLTASPSERAKRRFKELNGKKDVTYESVLKDILERDKKDMSREIAPLKQADDAILIDTTHLTIDEVSNKIINLVNERLKNYE